MEQPTDISLIDELGLKNNIEIVAQDKGKIVYAHTVYYELEDIDYEKYVTETDEPVDNIFSEKQQRLSIDILEKNIMTAVVPDMFLSFDVPTIKDWFEKKHKAYFTWVMGKPPELVLEIVSNKVGDEDTLKLDIYAKMGVKYYIIQDPYQYLSKEKLRLYVLDDTGKYQKHIVKDEKDL
ncbi:MAG: Uma2 family endonuclease, partial [Cytophagales bacterium]